LIERYTREEMGRVWKDQNRYQKWLDVELAACEAWAKKGRIPKAALARIQKKAGFDVARIDEIEKTVKHDVIAFLTSVSDHIGEDSRYVHIGLTSSDVLDTSFALLLTEAADIIIDDLKQVMKALKKRARQHKNTVMMGRSHGIHAEPTTFGLKMALYYDEFGRNLVRMQAARATIACGKLSGAVGTFANIDPYIERYVLKKLKLRPEPVATQVVQRDRHAEFFSTLAIIASTVEKVAVEVRHLQRTEVAEVEESFTKGQKGSSAMPHKRNPILSENLTGLARLVRGYGSMAMENIVLWHERDISHSSVERVIGPDATILTDFMLCRLRGLIENMVVFPGNMKANIERSKGLVFSQRVLLKLAEGGLSREDAYAATQRNAMKVWKGGDDDHFLDMLLGDEQVTKVVKEEDIRSCFDIKLYLQNVDYIFERVFQKKKK